MKRRPREPQVPVERHDTLRHQIIFLLEEYLLSAREISHILRIPEKDVSQHLDHIKKSFHKTGRELVVMPAECEQCGFVFKKRTRLAKPGKCPMCHSTLIKPPLFSIPPIEGVSGSTEPSPPDR